MSALLQSLRHRKLVQWGLAYLAGGWLVLEAFGFIAENFGWPGGLVRVATVLLGFGFFATLILAWYHGEKGAQRVSGSELLLLTGLSVAAVTSVLFMDWGPAELTETSAASPAATFRAGWIAVLPFTNVSGDPDNEYFSEGLTYEITSALERIGDLRVISPGSSMSYKERGGRTLSDIGRDLGVKLLLDGGLRVSGGQMRLNAQLVDAETGEQVWSDSYDRELSTDEIFALQGDIADQIATALQAEESISSDRSAGPPTDNLDAYNAYLRGRYFFTQASPGYMERSIEEYERALDLDPGFALAYAALAESWLTYAHYGQPPHEVFPEGLRRARQALALDSTLADAQTTLADSKFHYEWDWEEAERGFLLALELGSTHSTPHSWYGGLLLALGRFDEALESITRAREMDPVAVSPRAFEAWVLYMTGRWNDAINAAQSTLDLNPNVAGVLETVGLSRLGLGEVDEAIMALRRAVELGGRRHTPSLAMALVAAGNPDEARSILSELEAAAAETYVPPYWLANVHAALGDREAALDQLEAAMDTRDAELTWLNVDPALESLRQEPRFQRIVREMGLEPQGPGTV